MLHNGRGRIHKEVGGPKRGGRGEEGEGGGAGGGVSNSACAPQGHGSLIKGDEVVGQQKGSGRGDLQQHHLSASSALGIFSLHPQRQRSSRWAPPASSLRAQGEGASAYGSNSNAASVTSTILPPSFSAPAASSHPLADQ